MTNGPVWNTEAGQAIADNFDANILPKMVSDQLTLLH